MCLCSDQTVRSSESLVNDGTGRREEGGGRESCRHQWRDETVPFPELPPRCPRCGALARPDIVWFGEALRPRDVEAAMQATRCDLFIAIGTSALVYPAAGFLLDARQSGAVTAEINPVSTPASGIVDHVVHGRAEEVLAALDLLLGP